MCFESLSDEQRGYFAPPRGYFAQPAVDILDYFFQTSFNSNQEIEMSELNYELAKNIKVCGSAIHCLQQLQIAANENSVIYNVTIGVSPFKKEFTYETIRPSFASNGHGRPPKSIPIQLMWRSTYKEYDNFL